MTDKSDYTNLVRTETEVVLPSQAVLQINIDVSRSDKKPTDTELAGLAIALNNLKALVLAGVDSAKEQGLGIKPSLGNRLRQPFGRVRRRKNKQPPGNG